MITTPSQMQLELGTLVRIGNKRGAVISVKMVPASAGGGFVALHKIKLTEIFKRGFGQTGSWSACVPHVVSPNYSAIVLDENRKK